MRLGVRGVRAERADGDDDAAHGDNRRQRIGDGRRRSYAGRNQAREAERQNQQRAVAQHAEGQQRDRRRRRQREVQPRHLRLVELRLEGRDGRAALAAREEAVARAAEARDDEAGEREHGERRVEDEHRDEVLLREEHARNLLASAEVERGRARQRADKAGDEDFPAARGAAVPERVARRDARCGAQHGHLQVVGPVAVRPIAPADVRQRERDCVCCRRC